MLTDRQTVVLNLLTASISAGCFNPNFAVKIPELTKDTIKNLGTIADIFLEVTNEIPHNAENGEKIPAILENLKNNNQALELIINGLNPDNNYANGS